MTRLAPMTLPSSMFSAANRGGAVALVVVDHSAGAAPLHGQPGLGAAGICGRKYPGVANLGSDEVTMTLLYLVPSPKAASDRDFQDIA
jgi:hypothetical protein